MNLPETKKNKCISYDRKRMVLMTYPVALLSLGGVKGQGGFAFFLFSSLIARGGAHSTYFLISDSVILSGVVLHDACSPGLIFDLVCLLEGSLSRSNTGKSTQF